MLTALIEAAVIAPISFALGVVVGVRIQHRKLTREVVVQARRLKTWLDRWLMLVVGGFMIVVSVLVWNGQRQHDDDQRQLQAQSACVTQYANRLYDSLTPRQAASESLQAADEAFNDALVTLLKDTLSAHPVQATSRADAVALAKAAQHKQMVADQLSTERADNPYPSPPKKVCPK